MRRPIRLWLVLSLLTVLAARLAGPSDIDDKDQPKTIAYTVDMAIHGRWLLPREPNGEETTKPPLYNWLDAPIVMATGLYDPWVFKLPAVFAGLATLAMVVGMTRRMARGFPGINATGTGAESTTARKGLVIFGRSMNDIEPIDIGMVAGIVWLASPLVFRQVYLARPDGLLTMFLTGAWIAGTVALEDSTTNQRRRRWSLLFWFCVGAAALTKGPAALLGPLYVVAAAKLIHGRFAVALRVGWWWGLPLALGMFASWLLPAYLLDREHVVNVLMGRELLDRLSSGTYAEATWAPWRSVFYLVTRFLPWSVLAIILLARVRVREWFVGPLGPAVVWVIVVTAFFSCSVGIIARYVSPAFVALAGISTASLILVMRRIGWRASHTAVIGYVVIVGIVVYHLFFSVYAREPYSDRYIRFAAAVRPIVKDDVVEFDLFRRNVIPSLLGRHEGGPGKIVPADAKWIIRPMMEGTSSTESISPVVISEPLRDVVPGFPTTVVPIGLYRAAGEGER